MSKYSLSVQVHSRLVLSSVHQGSPSHLLHIFYLSRVHLLFSSAREERHFVAHYLFILFCSYPRYCYNECEKFVEKRIISNEERPCVMCLSMNMYCREIQFLTIVECCWYVSTIRTEFYVGWPLRSDGRQIQTSCPHGYYWRFIVTNNETFLHSNRNS